MKPLFYSQIIQVKSMNTTETVSFSLALLNMVVIYSID